ncbi:MAG: helix-turn-helix domain-containing protein, partial [Candidatus Promineifilaceae bacterium]
ANNAPKLQESLPFRGYDESDYASSLQALAQRKLIKKSDDGYKITKKGKKLRKKAEDKTNRIFFGPWKVLDSNEQTRLSNLLIRMNFALENLAEKEAELAGA